MRMQRRVCREHFVKMSTACPAFEKSLKTALLRITMARCARPATNRAAAVSLHRKSLCGRATMRFSIIMNLTIFYPLKY